MISRVGAQRPGRIMELRVGPECSVLQSSVRTPNIMNCDYKVVLPEKKNGIPETGLTLAYTINPFGPSAGCVFIAKIRFAAMHYNWCRCFLHLSLSYCFSPLSAVSGP